MAFLPGWEHHREPGTFLHLKTACMAHLTGGQKSEPGGKPPSRHRLQATASKLDGTTSLPSNEDLFTTPAEQQRQPVLPLLTSATAWGPTTGGATATAPAAMPAGLNFTQARHCCMASHRGMMRWRLK